MSTIEEYRGVVAYAELIEHIDELDAVAKELWEALDSAVKICHQMNCNAYDAEEVRDEYRERFSNAT